jgi:hypothetical protein
MLLKALVPALAAAPYVAAQELMRFGCSQLTIDRIDPLVTPGISPAPHMHQVIGGNSFNITMAPGQLDPPRDSTCTTCTYAEDFSNYWTANIYFRARNGSFKRLPQFANLGVGALNGGATIYYIRGYQASAKVTAFKPGFRMLVGDPGNRKAASQVRQMCFRCEANKSQSPFGGAPCTGSDTAAFPNKPCGGGWRVSVHFPSCWDGKNTDSADHKSHIAYPASGTFESGGACPSTHPVKIPQVMYEIMFDSSAYNDKALWPEDGSQPFYWSMGDKTGFGMHGDYLFGWKGDALQRAMDTKCSGGACPALKTQSAAAAVACNKKQMYHEPIGDQWITDLPGLSSNMY